MDSIQLSIKASEEQQDILIAELSETGAIGFEQQHDHLIAWFHAAGYPEEEVNELLKEFVFTITTVQQQNWNAVWEENFQPVVVDDFCAIRAHFHPVQAVTYDIIITPKMSFGTGHHATTYMMIEQMRGLDFTGKKVFDFGTGTGILAILAEKLGAASVYAIDVDEWSIENARENVERNDCHNIILELTTRIPEQQFDILLANINRNVILQYLPELKEIIKAGGVILLSGLLRSDEEDVKNACLEVGWSHKNTLEKNNWISMVFHAPAH